MAEQLKEALLPYADQIERAFIYGSIARDEDTAQSDIDLFILSDTIGTADLYPVLMKTESELGRKVSLSVYRTAEYQRKLEVRNHFLITILNGPVIELIGRANAEQGTR